MDQKAESESPGLFLAVIRAPRRTEKMNSWNYLVSSKAGVKSILSLVLKKKTKMLDCFLVIEAYECATGRSVVLWRMYVWRIIPLLVVFFLWGSCRFLVSLFTILRFFLYFHYLTIFCLLVCLSSLCSVSPVTPSGRIFFWSTLSLRPREE